MNKILKGKVGIANRTSYAASKHALTGYFDSLRVEVFKILNLNFVNIS